MYLAYEISELELRFQLYTYILIVLLKINIDSFIPKEGFLSLISCLFKSLVIIDTTSLGLTVPILSSAFVTIALTILPIALRFFFGLLFELRE